LQVLHVFGPPRSGSGQNRVLTKNLTKNYIFKTEDDVPVGKI
jgi:hypothetical protein